MKVLKKIWKTKLSRVWMCVAIPVLVIFLVVSLVLTQNEFIYNTVCIVLGKERQVVVSGDASDTSLIRYKTDEGITTKAQALAAAEAVNESVVEEGIVLLKNTTDSNGNGALPLSKGANVSVFGKNSVNLVYSGSGSAGSSNSGSSIYDSLTAVGLNYNTVLKNFYDSTDSGSGRDSNPSMGSYVTGLATGETPVSSYSSSVKSSFNQYKDAAIVVISRISGEGFDLPRTMKKSYTDSTKVNGAVSADSHYLELDQNERDMLDMVCSAGFGKVIVVINSANTMELGFLDDVNYYSNANKIDAALQLGLPGANGVMALGKILTGEVNPSGRVSDTYVRDFTKDPTWYNFGDYTKQDGNLYYDSDGDESQFHYVNYEEGIYVGYRYWETRGYTDGEEWYKNNVVYPLGYGLSYTTFSTKVDEYKLISTDGTSGDLPATLSADDLKKSISVDVTVTNTGKVSGKQVVQVYVSAPYYNGGIEKAQVVLAGFAKTDELAAGASQKVTVEFSLYDIASYDNKDANGNGFKGYELEAGDYTIYVAENAHGWASDSTPSHKFSVPKTSTDNVTGYKYATDTTTDYTVENRFDDVSEGVTNLLSRTSWNLPTDYNANATISDANLSKMTKYVVNDTASDPWYTDTMPTTGKATDLKLYDMIGLDYDDAKWDELLDSLTVSDMMSAIGTCAFNTGKISSIDKPTTTEADGPVGFTNFMGDPTIYDTCNYASACIVAATWNVDLAYKLGAAVGNEALIGNEAGDGVPYSGWYAPGVNIHRSQFGGRNTEYYSEDGLLAGKLGSAVVQGAKSKGVYTYVKHFVLNDQETDRSTMGLLTWADEQSMRELYFKPFEYIVKEGEATGIMTSFNRIGTTWAGGSYNLLTEVLRNEWGFHGSVITDYDYMTPYMYGDLMIRAGGDLNFGQSTNISDLSTPTQVACLRRATHNMLYTVANSNAMNGHGEGVVYGYALPYWVIGVICVDVVVFVGLAVWGVFAILKALKNKNVD